MKRENEIIKQAHELDNQNPEVQMSMSGAYTRQKKYEKAIIAGKRAITLNPNYSMGHAILGMTLYVCGQFDEAVTLVKKAKRLNPKLNPALYAYLARSYIHLGHYEEALKIINQLEVQALNENLRLMKSILFSWYYQELGREEEARAKMAEALKIDPEYSLKGYAIRSPHKNPAHLQRELDALRKAGLPEKPGGVVK